MNTDFLDDGSFVVVIEYSAYLFRGLPTYGKVFVSNHFLSFKSVGILAKTKVSGYKAIMNRI